MSEELPILMGPGVDAPETLLLVSRPDAGGMVAVRTWSADDWGAAHTERTERAESLLRWIESQAALGRTINQSMYAVHLWLRGIGIRPSP